MSKISGCTGRKDSALLHSVFLCQLLESLRVVSEARRARRVHEHGVFKSRDR
jgi:hypothetical protein